MIHLQQISITLLTKTSKTTNDALIRIYKSFVRSHLDYVDIACDTPNESFASRLERVQFKSCLAIKGTKYHKSCKNKYGNYHLNCITKKNENLDKEIEI